MKANILVVDDRQDKLLVVQAILEDLGQNIFTAGSGEEALRQVLARDFALILLDVNMPGLDGLETAALIRNRKRSAHIPIIFITADYADELRTTKGYSLGAVDYITSPIVPEVLRAKVRVFVDLYLLAEQAKQQAQQRIALAEEKAARQAAERATRRLAFLAEATGTLAASARNARRREACSAAWRAAFSSASAMRCCACCFACSARRYRSTKTRTFARSTSGTIGDVM